MGEFFFAGQKTFSRKGGEENFRREDSFIKKIKKICTWRSLRKAVGRQKNRLEPAC